MPNIFGGGATTTDRSTELQSMGLQSGVASSLTGAGTGTLASGTQSMQSVMGQLQKIMGGGQAGLEAVAPQVNTVASQYQGARQAASQLSPRGGGRNSTLANSQTAEMGDVQKMMFGAADKARGQLGTLSSQMASLGLGEEATGIGASEGAADIGLQNAPFAAQQQQQIGQSLGGLLSLFMG